MAFDVIPRMFLGVIFRCYSEPSFMSQSCLVLGFDPTFPNPLPQILFCSREVSFCKFTAVFALLRLTTFQFW